jgi:hypothetical protein
LPPGGHAAAAHSNLLASGLILRFRLNPSPWRLNYPYHGLPAGMHVNVFHRNLLHALAAMAIESVEQKGIAARKFAAEG